jgi:hypothetical protein
MTELEKILTEAFVNGVLVSLILGYFITTRDERIKNTIQDEFKRRDAFFNAQFEWKRRSLEELLGPISMQLKRSSIALNAYEQNDPYREQILKQTNETIRDLLLTKSFLIPTALVPDAGEFIKHYDNWLQAYDRYRVRAKDKSEPFVFTYDFPHQAEVNFVKTYEAYRRELKIETVLQ